jgi:hypothetical protein
LPYAALLVEILLCYRKVLFRPSRYAIPWDLQFYHLPLAEFMAKSFREGHLPLWDPFTYCGWPIYAELTAQVFYPPTILAVLASNLTGGSHLLYFIELQLIAHVLAGGSVHVPATAPPGRERGGGIDRRQPLSARPLFRFSGAASRGD